MQVRRIGLVALIATLTMPVAAMAQQQTCEQRAAIMGQLIEDMGRARAVVSAAEVEAASLKVQVKALQAEIEKAKQDIAKKPEAAPEHGTH